MLVVLITSHVAAACSSSSSIAAFEEAIAHMLLLLDAAVALAWLVWELNGLLPCLCGDAAVTLECAIGHTKVLPCVSLTALPLFSPSSYRDTHVLLHVSHMLEGILASLFAGFVCVHDGLKMRLYTSTCTHAHLCVSAAECASFDVQSLCLGL
jgi:hypothetical protein